MTEEADNPNSYEEYQKQVQSIQLANQPILDNFENWLYQSALSEKTIKDHVDNIRFFAKYLAMYEFSPRRLDEANQRKCLFLFSGVVPSQSAVVFCC